jgi:hypothetical protein
LSFRIRDGRVDPHDAQILTSYEGTTAIRANDFVGRKTLRDGGLTAKAVAKQTEATESELLKHDGAARTMAKREMPLEAY